MPLMLKFKKKSKFLEKREATAEIEGRGIKDSTFILFNDQPFGMGKNRLGQLRRTRVDCLIDGTGCVAKLFGYRHKRNGGFFCELAVYEVALKKSKKLAKVIAKG